METLNLPIFRHFEGSFAYTEILEFLRVRHVYIISLSTLKRMLMEKEMRKRPLEVVRNDTSYISEAVKDDLSGSGVRLQNMVT